MLLSLQKKIVSSYSHNIPVMYLGLLSSDKYFQLLLQSVLLCFEVIVRPSHTVFFKRVKRFKRHLSKNPQATQAEEKLEDVETKIMQILMEGCPECSSDVLDEQSFSCFKESPSFLTYRARLEGTSKRDSKSLV